MRIKDRETIVLRLSGKTAKAMRATLNESGCLQSATVAAMLHHWNALTAEQRVMMATQQVRREVEK